MPKTSRRRVGRAQMTADKISPRMQPPTDEEGHVDGCDADFDKGDLTSDTELPASTGGVETVRKTHRRAPQRRK